MDTNSNNQGSNNGDNNTYISNNLGSHLKDGAAGSATTICVPEPMGSTDFIRKCYTEFYFITIFGKFTKYLSNTFETKTYLSRQFKFFNIF
jgi:hypothetical protein